METILVAGGAGFIGSHLCSRLLQEGKRVICIDSLITGSLDNIKPHTENPQFSFIQHDITQDVKGVLSSEQEIDGIFHLASPASPNKKSKRSYINFPIETMLVNSCGTYNLLEATKQYNAKFLFVSTSEIYGNPTVSPQNESYFGNVNPIGVRSVYDEGKRFGEAMTMAYIRKDNINARIIRIFNTYGPNMQVDDGRAISNFIVQALKGENLTVYGDGKQTRSFCYITDMIDGLYSAFFSENTQGEAINIGNPDERSILDIAQIVKRITNATSEIVYEPLPQDDPMIRQPDISKAKRLFGFEPKVGLEEGLLKTVAYYKSVLSV